MAETITGEPQLPDTEAMELEFSWGRFTVEDEAQKVFQLTPRGTKFVSPDTADPNLVPSQQIDVNIRQRLARGHFIGATNLQFGDLASTVGTRITGGRNTTPSVGFVVGVGGIETRDDYLRLIEQARTAKSLDDTASSEGGTTSSEDVLGIRTPFWGSDEVSPEELLLSNISRYAEERLRPTLEAGYVDLKRQEYDRKVKRTIKSGIAAVSVLATDVFISKYIGVYDLIPTVVGTGGALYALGDLYDDSRVYEAKTHRVNNQVEVANHQVDTMVAEIQQAFIF